MNYVRAIVDHGVLLRAGAIYPVLPPEANDGSLLRIADETSGEASSEGGYLFPAAYFEIVEPDELHTYTTSAATVHLLPTLYGILRAEASVANQSVSALLRT